MIHHSLYHINREISTHTAKIRCFRAILAMRVSLWSTIGQLLRYFQIQQDRLYAASHIRSLRFTLRHSFRHSFTAMQIILFERVRVNSQCHIWKCMTCSLCCVFNTDTRLQLQAHRCMIEHPDAVGSDLPVFVSSFLNIHTVTAFTVTGFTALNIKPPFRQRIYEEYKWYSTHISHLYNSSQVRIMNGFAFLFMGSKGHARTLVTVIAVA